MSSVGRSRGNRRKSSGRRQRVSYPPRSTTVRPPSFNPNIIVVHRYRFTAPAAFNSTPITGRFILGAMGNICTANNASVRSIFNAFRIISIKMWSVPSTLGSAATVSLNYVGAVNGPPVQIADTTNDVSAPAYISSTPPTGSTASFWQNPVTTDYQLFTLASTGLGTIVDLVVEGLIADENLGLSTGVATATLAQPYYLALDGVATHTIVPSGLVTTF